MNLLGCWDVLGKGGGSIRSIRAVELPEASGHPLSPVANRMSNHEIAKIIRENIYVGVDLREGIMKQVSRLIQRAFEMDRCNPFRFIALP